ncbi:hypothetical protein C2W64_04752 [Brevibacillus laterosporus]|nr:hypothetical protein C2W64_04752 [Brevibacillus laterosporus]
MKKSTQVEQKQQYFIRRKVESILLEIFQEEVQVEPTMEECGKWGKQLRM